MSAFIRTIEQFADQVGVNVDTDLANVQRSLRVAEGGRLRELLGPLYGSLQALTDEEVATLLEPGSTDVRAELLQLVQCAAANLAMVHYLPFVQVQIDDAGISLRVAKTAFQWQVNDLKGAFSATGYSALEDVLRYLEAHRDAAELAAWKTSPAATRARRHFLATATDFSQYYDIADSRLTYLALLATLRKVEMFHLEPLLGTSYYQELKAELLTGTLSEDSQLVLDEYLRPALAHLTVAKAVPEVGLAYQGNSLQLNIYRFDDSNNKEADAGLDALLTLKIDQAWKDGQVYLTKLRTFLNASASTTRFATYFASPTYTDPTAPRPVVSNAATNATYRVF